ncbi:MAG TPA: phytanoyl-CoA dioxygenase family protein [Stellaceae bacterium]|nr:phytanoyl-CoA dioxygenase family protein [Stellaceae bacterium]
MKDGYVLLKGLLTATELGRIVMEIHDVFARSAAARGIAVTRGPDGRVPDRVLFELFDQDRATYIASMRLIQNLPSLFAFGSDQRLLAVLRELGLDQPVYSSRPIVTLSSRRTSQNIGHWKTPPHQDWRSVQGSLNGVVVWHSLFDVVPSLGPLEVVPGSHLLGLLEAEEDIWYMRVPETVEAKMNFVPVETRAGDVLVFSQFLLHRSGTNLEERHRYAIQYRYNDASEPTYLARGYPTAYRSDAAMTKLVTPGFGTARDVAAIFGDRTA